MFLILSAAYVGQELQSEFGKIPPSFLPLGNRRLFQHQVNLAPEGVKVYLSVPESYGVSTIDQRWLAEQQVTLLRIPENISLGASIVAALNLSYHDLNLPLHILFGDTLFTELPQGDDLICVSEAKESYDWAVVTNEEAHWVRETTSTAEAHSQNVVNGYFKFSQPRELIRSLTKANWQFLEGLNNYHQQLGLSSTYSDKWLDFGHVNSYYHSKANFTTQRAFNDLSIHSDWIEKSSLKEGKIAAEAHWFSTLPYALRRYIPQFLGCENNGDRLSYRLEYLHQTALNELYVFSELSSRVWEPILRNCLAFLEVCQQEQAPQQAPYNSLEDLLQAKTLLRLEEYFSDTPHDLDTLWELNTELPVSLRTILQECSSNLPAGDSLEHISVLHGDFCFSNILYDFRADKIKAIDPRGLTAKGEFSIYGDVRYDVAKLSHSVLGMYDWIIAGYYQLEVIDRKFIFSIEFGQQQKIIQQRFIELVKQRFSLEYPQLLAMQVNLFLSMLPLHHDDPQRQQALFANALRIYFLMKRLEQ